MKKWRYLLIPVVLMFLANLLGSGRTTILAARTLPGSASLLITDLQRIYQSPEINEAPFFAADCVVFESGDNRNDHFTLIPFDGFGNEPFTYKNEKSLRQLENPRSDVPDSNKLVFSAISATGKKNIYCFEHFNAYNFDKSPVPVCLLANTHNNWNPSFNSKLGLLAYVSDAVGAPQIFLYNVKTKKNTQMTSLAQAQHPFIDARGEWIYFTGIDQSGNYDIYKIRTTGQNLVRLTSGPEIEKYPTLTRYGRWIAFERGTNATRSIWIMSLDGQTQKQLSATDHWASTACLNYTGTKIAFEGVINGIKGIYLGGISESAYAGATAKEFTPGLDVQKEVVNLAQFGEFTPAQLQKLSQYGFFAAPTDKKQLFYAYEENEYKNIPSFVTTDNLLQLLHILFDTSLRQTEEHQLLPKLKRLSRALLVETAKRPQLAKDPNFRAFQRYCYVFYYLLNNRYYQPSSLADKDIVRAEIRKIDAAQWAVSAIFPDTKYDYSLFKVRGHYSNNANLRVYFRAMSWLGLMTFNSKTPDSRRRICLGAELLTANPEIQANLNAIYKITAFYAGESDTPNFAEFVDLWQQEYHTRPSYARYNDQQCQLILGKLFIKHPKRIQTFYADPAKNQSEVLALMGKRYLPDAYLFSRLFQKLGPKYLPGGLDLFAALDNPTAQQLLRDELTTGQQYPDYQAAEPGNREIFSGCGTGKPETTLFNRWLSLLKTYVNSNETKAPAVLRTSHWQKKKLTAALASWTELKHDTILYGEQVAAECGGGDERPKVCGYIEPELTFYKALRQNLLTMDHDLGALNGGTIHELNRIIELIDFFILVSQKELDRLPLTEAENEQIRIIGGLLEANTITALDAQVRWEEITSESARNMALVADIFSYWAQYQTEGVGYADDLYIIIPVNEQLYLMRGSIFSYYEFLHTKRLNDTEWYQMLKSVPLEKRSKWWQNYLDRKKDEIPVPADPYDSGC